MDISNPRVKAQPPRVSNASQKGGRQGVDRLFSGKDR